MSFINQFTSVILEPPSADGVHEDEDDFDVNEYPLEEELE